MKELVKAIFKGAVGGSMVMNLYLLFLGGFALEYDGIISCYKEQFGTGVSAAAVQLITFAGMGIAVSLCIYIRRQERMGLLMQSVLQYAFLSIGCFPICVISGMVRTSLVGILAYAGVLLLLYAVLWAAQMAAIKNRLGEMNAALEGKVYRARFQVVPYLIIVFGMYYVIPAVFFLVSGGSDEAILAINFLNYFLYPFLLFLVGVLCGIKVGGNLWYPATAAVLIVPISFGLYQDISYTVLLCIVFGAIAGVANLIGWALKKAGIHF